MAEAKSVISSLASFEAKGMASALTGAFTKMQFMMDIPFPYAYIAHLRSFLCIWLVGLPIILTIFMRVGYTGTASFGFP